MKYLLGLILLSFSTNLCFGKEKIIVVYNEDYSVSLNGTSIDNLTTYSKIVDLLGEPEIYKEYPTGKTNYRYTELGFVFHKVNGKLLTFASKPIYENRRYN